MSVRAVPGQDASALCAKFGGGGHKGAAGASMNCPMDEAVEKIRNAMLNLYGIRG
jgi:phosphoesterase RecJ-like protein